MPGNSRWTEAEDELIREHADRDFSWNGWEGLLPGRTRSAIRQRRRKLGLADEAKSRARREAKPWTPEEDAVILAHPDKSQAWPGYAELLPGRSAQAIQVRRHRLDVKGAPQVRRPPANAWTEAEDDVVREHPDNPPSWPGYGELLPGRSASAINKRRNKLGVHMSDGKTSALRGKSRPTVRTEAGLKRGPVPKAKPRNAPKAKPAAAPSTKPTSAPAPWTPEQDVALVEAFVDMLDATGHNPAECVTRLARIRNAYRKGS